MTVGCLRVASSSTATICPSPVGYRRRQAQMGSPRSRRRAFRTWPSSRSGGRAGRRRWRRRSPAPRRAGSRGRRRLAAAGPSAPRSRPGRACRSARAGRRPVRGSPSVGTPKAAATPSRVTSSGGSAEPAGDDDDVGVVGLVAQEGRDLVHRVPHRREQPHLGDPARRGAWRARTRWCSRRRPRRSRFRP